MSIIVTSYQDKIKPVSFIEQAKVNFITMVGRAANWTPWAQKSEEEGQQMAGEIVQAILMPVGGNTEDLKALFGDDIVMRLNSAKAEKYDGGTKYVLADEKRFAQLDAQPIGQSGVKMIFGTMNSAEKFDVDNSLIPVPSAGPVVVSFSDILWDKGRALRGAIEGYVALGNDWAVIENNVQAAIDAYSVTIMEALAALRQQTETNAAAMKSDTGGGTAGGADGRGATAVQAQKQDNKPSIFGRLFRSTGGGTAAKTDNTSEGKMDFSKEQVEELLVGAAEKAAEAAAAKTIEALGQKEQTEEARKAEQVAKEAELAEKAEMKTKLDTVLAWIEAQKAEEDAAAAQAAGGVETETQAQLDAMKAEMDAAKQKYDEIAEKMDVIRRAHNPAPQQDRRLAVVEGEAKKGDEAYDAFADMCVK